MTLQWTVVALILYVEIGAVLILLLPWIRPTIWKKLFNSRLVCSFKRFSTVYSYSVIVVLLLLFFDAAREVRKYTNTNIGPDTRHLADADAIVHMRLFRAQRNLYISGFSLLLSLVINRIVGLLSRSAHLEAAAEAAMKQAESATKTAKALMEADNFDGSLSEFEKDKKELLKKLKTAETDRDAMKDQAKNLQDEYDRVCDRLNKLETKAGSGGDKKDN